MPEIKFTVLNDDVLVAHSVDPDATCAVRDETAFDLLRFQGLSNAMRRVYVVASLEIAQILALTIKEDTKRIAITNPGEGIWAVNAVMDGYDDGVPAIFDLRLGAPRAISHPFAPVYDQGPADEHKHLSVLDPREIRG